MCQTGQREVNRFKDIVNNEAKPQVHGAVEMDRGEKERVNEEEGGKRRQALIMSRGIYVFFTCCHRHEKPIDL